jgi:predicted nucleic acid-binding protein
VTSRPIRSVAADSNVLLSAIAGQAARRVFEKAPHLVVVSTLHNKEEIEQYAPEFAERYGLEEELILDVLELLPVEFYSETDYVRHLPEARKLLASRDPDDVALAALALTLEIPIWSNDRDYESFPFGVFTTAQLLKALGV